MARFEEEDKRFLEHREEEGWQTKQRQALRREGRMRAREAVQWKHIQDGQHRLDVQ